MQSTDKSVGDLQKEKLKKKLGTYSLTEVLCGHEKQSVRTSPYNTKPIKTQRFFLGHLAETSRYFMCVCVFVGMGILEYAIIYIIKHRQVIMHTLRLMNAFIQVGQGGRVV